MTSRREDWQRVQTVFAAALERGPADRAPWLDEACANEPFVREEVDALLESHDRAGQFLALDGAPASPAIASDALAGVRAGPFALVRELGRGGMSVVYLAERVDGGFTQAVAVKILDAPLRIDEVRERFLAERQILARFAHPNIVSFLDAGVTADGRPYLVMERVDGQPLTRYCATRRLELPGRLALLGQLCRALQYAHQHGVVHRDLKPANVLVTPDGVVKVLDFGIAKLLDDSIVSSGGDATVAGAARALTPSYASPEQLRGDTVTTATDIYTIGVVMYELLSGRRPYDAGERTLSEIVTLVANTTPARPSAAGDDAARPYPARALRGDLDAIVRKAMAPAPADRYASAQQIADDLVRHAAGEPIEARRVSITYVLTRLARRHRAAVVASTVSLAALVVALGVSVWQTRAARLDRDRAERRFNDARELARTLIFKVHDAVQPLPGSTPVRQMIVAEALTYLERLSRDPAGDDGLRLELARGYHRVADVQGKPSSANLGDRAGSEASYRKALALLRPIAKGPVAREAALELGRIDLALATLRGINTYDEAATGAISEALAVGTRLLAADGDDEEAERLVASAQFQRALAAPHDGALAEWTKTGALFDALLAKKPDDLDRQRNVALVEKYIGSHHEDEQAYGNALPHFARALEIDRERLARQPSRAVNFDVAVDLSNVAMAENYTGRSAEAIDHLSQCLAIREELSTTDPKDVLARERLGLTFGRLGRVYRGVGRLNDALDALRKSVSIYEEVAPLDAHSRRELSATLSEFGQVERQSGLKKEACRDFQRAGTLVDALLAEHALTSITARLQDDRRWLGKALAECGSAP
jgi:tetratricopeptide (TPR) repeat protein/tRNA A-37 threonylcarbamoyl transferase component Bud32